MPFHHSLRERLCTPQRKVCICIPKRSSRFCLYNYPSNFTIHIRYSLLGCQPKGGHVHDPKLGWSKLSFPVIWILVWKTKTLYECVLLRVVTWGAYHRFASCRLFRAVSVFSETWFFTFSLSLWGIPNYSINSSYCCFLKLANQFVLLASKEPWHTKLYIYIQYIFLFCRKWDYTICTVLQLDFFFHLIICLVDFSMSIFLFIYLNPLDLFLGVCVYMFKNWGHSTHMVCYLLFKLVSYLNRISMLIYGHKLWVLMADYYAIAWV